MKHQQSSARFTPKVLRQVLEQAIDSRAVFTLHVSDAPNEKVIYFAGGGVRLLTCGDRACGDVTSWLLQTGRLDVDSIHGALEAVRKQNRALKDALIEKKLLSRDEWNDTVGELFRRELFDLVFWDEAFYSCYEGAPPKAIYDTDKALVGSPDLARLEDDVEAWTKQWEQQRRRLHSDRAILRATRAGTFGIEKAEGDAKRCLELCLNGIDVRSLWIRSRIDLPILCDRLIELIDEAWIEVEAPPRGAAADAEIAERIEALEASLDRVIGKDLVREKLIGLYKRAGRVDRAVAELVSLADSALQSGQWPLAVDRLKRVLALDPERIEVLERVLKIYLEQRLEREAMTFAQTHVHALIERKLHAAAKAAGKLIRRLNSSSLESREIFAAISAGGGDLDGAVEQYLSLARELAEKGSKNEAIRTLEHALKTCPEHPLLEAELASLDPHFAAKIARLRDGNTRKRSMLGPAPAASLVALLVVATTLAVLDRSGVISIKDAFESVVASALESRTHEESPDGDKVFADPRIPDGAVTEVVHGVEVPIEGDEGLDVHETFPGGSHGAAAPTIPGLIPRGAPSDSSTADTEPGAAGSSQSGGFVSIPPSLLLSKSESERARGSGLPPRLSSSRANYEIPDVRAPAQAPAGAGDASSPLPLPSIEAHGASFAQSIRLAGDGDKVRVVGGLALLDHQSETDWLPGRAGVPDELRARAAAHVAQGRDLATETRVVDRELLVAWADSGPYVGVNPSTGGEIFRFPGRHGFRWAVGYRGERVCRWRVGFQPLIFRAISREPIRLGWDIPPGTEAVAIGYERVALRVGAMTYVYTTGGEPLHASELVAWDEGVFIDQFLVLTRQAQNAGGPRGVWIIHVNVWLPIWCSVESGERLETR